jgi:hypothetical protein
MVDRSVAALITKATGRRSACRTPRVGELRPLRPVSLTCCVNKTKGVSAHKNLNWLDSSQKARYRRTRRTVPRKGRRSSLPAGRAAATWGRCATQGLSLPGHRATSRPEPTAYLRHCDRLSIGAAAARCSHRTTRHICARVVKPTHHMDSTGRLRDRVPNTQHQPSVYFPDLQERQ